MPRNTRAARLCRSLMITLTLALASFSPAWGQAFQEDCTDATLDGTDMLPISDAGVSGGDSDFTVPMACELGATSFSDAITCFTPTNTCDVQFDCTTGGGSAVRASIVEGPCTGTFGTCLAAGSSVVPPSTSSVSLTLNASTSYCFLCENTVGNAAFDVSITTAGDCGPLPVELLEFHIEGE